MESPKSRQHKEKLISYRRRKHKNKKFYNSKAWRDTREAYIRRYQARLWRNAADGVWKDSNGNRLVLEGQKALKLLSLDYLPCEICLKLYIADAYDTMEKGVELDHIEPVNKENALESKEHGDPLNLDNLQLLCRRHHAKKSQRER